MWLLPALSGLSRAAARSFYRLQIVGPEVSAKGPVLLLANHPNSLLDPALVGAAAGRPVRFLAKSTLFSDSRVGWLVRGSGAIPVYRRSDDAEAASRNVQMFEAVFTELAGGAAVGIFPEGISHSMSSLAKLKTGSARIALGSYARVDKVFPLVPIGLVLRHKGVFRSDALIIRGVAVDWEDLANRGVEDPEAVRELTDRLDQALREVTLNLERWEDQPLIECAEGIWSAEMTSGGEEEEVEQVQRAQTAARVLADFRRRGDDEWQGLAREVNAHRRRLRLLGLQPSDLDAKVDLATGAGWTVRRMPLLGPPAILVGVSGALIFWVPYQVTDRIVRAFRPDAVQSCTYKVLVGALIYLLWILLLTVLAWRFLGPWPALAVFLVAPFFGLVAQRIRELWRDAWSDVRRFFVLRSRREVLAQLKEEQSALATRLHDAYTEWRQQDSAAH